MELKFLLKNVFQKIGYLMVHTPLYLKFQNAMFHSKVLQFNMF